MKEKDKHKEVEKLLLLQDYIPGLKEEMNKLFKKGYYNILLYMHLGDNFFRASMKNDLEELYGQVHFIIKPSDEILMKLFNITEYSIFDIDKYINENLKVPKNIKPFILDYYKCACIENSISCEPNPNEVFIIFPRNHHYNLYVRKLGRPATILNWLNSAANILKKTKINISEISYPNIIPSLQEKLNKNNLDINKVVLIAPETISDELLNPKFWNKLTKNILKLGYTVVENITNTKYHIKNAINLNLNTEELISLGINCHSVFSVRSGLCDVIIGKRENLFVFFPGNRYEDIKSRFGFNNNFNFQGKNRPIEIILSNKEKPFLLWNNTNILKNIKKTWLPKIKKENILCKIFSIKNTKDHKVISILGIRIKVKYNSELTKINNIQKNYEHMVKKLCRKNKHNKINVVFLVYQNSKWKSQSLYDKLAKDSHFNVQILLTIADFQIYYSHKERVRILEKNYNFFKKRNMNVEYAWDLNRNIPKDIKIFEPDIIFYQSPYTFYEKHQIKQLSKYALCCYVPYYINQSENFNLMNSQNWHKSLYRWYVLDEYWQNISEKLIKGDPYKRIKPVGHTMLDSYYSSKVNNKEHYIIYAAHWSAGIPNGLSTFTETGYFMLEYAKSHPQFNWVFTHHPSLTYSIVEKGIMTKDEIQNYYNEWKKIAYFYDEGDYINLFQNSDMLISDCGSFRVEYFPTGKPYVYLIGKNPNRLKDGEFLNKITKYYYKVYDKEQLKTYLDMLLIAKEDPFKQDREEHLKSLTLLNTNAADNIIKDLYEILKLKTK